MSPGTDRVGGSADGRWARLVQGIPGLHRNAPKRNTLLLLVYVILLLVLGSVLRNVLPV